MKIDYEVIWTEDCKMFFKRFSYDIDKKEFPIKSYLPNDVFIFFDNLVSKGFPVIVCAGEDKESGTGILTYVNANPIE